MKNKSIGTPGCIIIIIAIALLWWGIGRVAEEYPPAQLVIIPLLILAGIGVWILINSVFITRNTNDTT